MAVAWGEEVFGRLTSDVTVGAATADGVYGHRVFANVAEQDAIFPRVVYQIVVERTVNSLAGFTSRLRGATVQIDAYADSYLDARNLGDAISAVFEGVVTTTFWASLSARRENYEVDVRKHRVSLDFELWSNEP